MPLMKRRLFPVHSVAAETYVMIIYGLWCSARCKGASSHIISIYLLYTSISHLAESDSIYLLLLGNLANKICAVTTCGLDEEETRNDWCQRKSTDDDEGNFESSILQWMCMIMQRRSCSLTQRVVSTFSSHTTIYCYMKHAFSNTYILACVCIPFAWITY